MAEAEEAVAGRCSVPVGVLEVPAAQAALETVEERLAEEGGEDWAVKR